MLFQTVTVFMQRMIFLLIFDFLTPSVVSLNQLQSGWESWDVEPDPVVSEQRKVGHVERLEVPCLFSSLGRKDMFFRVFHGYFPSCLDFTVVLFPPFVIFRAHRTEIN